MTAAQGGGVKVLSGNGENTINNFNVKESYQNLECGRGENSFIEKYILSISYVFLWSTYCHNSGQEVIHFICVPFNRESDSYLTS